MALWHDKRGRFSILRAVTLVVLIAPLLALIYFTATQNLGARPRTEAIHEVGLWGLRFLMASLFITPLRRIGRYAMLIDVRRMIGVASALYMVRQLGGLRWRNLHRLAYPITIFSCVHYFMQSKLQVFEPTWISGIFVWLMLYRFLHWRFPRQDEFPLSVIAGTWFFVGALTFLLEAFGFWLAFRAPPLRVLEADFTFVAGIRPGWYVWGVGAIVTLIGLIRLRPASGSFRLATSGAGQTK